MGSVAVDPMERAHKREAAHTRPQGSQWATGMGVYELPVSFYGFYNQFTLRHDTLWCLMWPQPERVVRWDGLSLIQRYFDASEVIERAPDLERDRGMARASESHGIEPLIHGELLMVQDPAGVHNSLVCRRVGECEGTSAVPVHLWHSFPFLGLGPIPGSNDCPLR